jgi:hypothetical protein
VFFIFHLPIFFPITIGSFVIMQFSQNLMFIRHAQRAALQTYGFRLKCVTLGGTNAETAARLQFKDGTIVYAMDLSEEGQRAVRTFARHLEADFATLLMPLEAYLPFRASVNRGRHFLFGLVKATRRIDVSLRDMLDRFPSGGRAFIDELIEQSRQTLQWGLQGSLEELRPKTKQSFELKGLPFDVRIVCAKAFPNHQRR